MEVHLSTVPYGHRTVTLARMASQPITHPPKNSVRNRAVFQHICVARSLIHVCGTIACCASFPVESSAETALFSATSNHLTSSRTRAMGAVWCAESSHSCTTAAQSSVAIIQTAKASPLSAGKGKSTFLSDSTFPTSGGRRYLHLPPKVLGPKQDLIQSREKSSRRPSFGGKGGDLPDQCSQANKRTNRAAPRQKLPAIRFGEKGSRQACVPLQNIAQNKSGSSIRVRKLLPDTWRAVAADSRRAASRHLAVHARRP